MEKAKKKRTVVRTSFTKTVNILKEEIRKDDTDINIGNLKDGLSKIDNLIKDLKDLDEIILDALLDTDASEDDISKEVENTDEYSDEYITVKRIVNEKLCPASNNKLDEAVVGGSNDHNSACKIKTYRLPKIELKKFDGEIINYLPFWSQFRKIHEDENLDDSDKFHYLLQSVQPGTRARELLESYPITSANYAKAVDALEQRFGKKELLVEVYVRELLQLIICNVKSNGKERLPLGKLFDKVEAHLRALESMGVNTEANAAWLYPMVESSLSEDVLKAWQRSSFYGCHTPEDSSGSNLSRLAKLMDFLKREVEGEQRMLLARKGFEDFVSKVGTKDKTIRETSRPTAASLFAGREPHCLFCDKQHDSKDCFSARTMSLKDKTAKVKEKRCCLRCLKPGHLAKFCKSSVRCHICNKGHSILFCPELPLNKGSEQKKEIQEVVQNSFSQQACTNEVALMTLGIEIVGKNTVRRVRAMLDCGSQRSYIKQLTAKELGLEPVSTENIAHSLFGGSQTESKPHRKYRIKLRSCSSNSRSTFEFDFLDQNIICGKIPRLPKGSLLKELKKHKIWVSDIGSGSPEIELLLGSDIYGKILTGRIKQLQGGLTAIETTLGWTVCGQHDGSSIEAEKTFGSSLITNLALRQYTVSDLWKLETIGITDIGETLTKAAEEEMAQAQFLNSLRRSEDGRYCVGLPWLDEKHDIPSNRHIAEKRLFSTTRKLKSLKAYEEYDKVFREWLDEGVIERVPHSELELKGHYLPHHAVIKPDSLTTKIRPVFDASCHAYRTPSLNDCLVKGPNLIEQIPAILLRFREKSIGVVADIRRAFLQIEVKKEDRDYLRFLWWDTNDRIQVLRHNRVVFGVTSSPFLLGAVILYHLSNAVEEYKPIAVKLSNSFYIDNCITSVEDESELKKFMDLSTDMLAEIRMELRMWEFGPKHEINLEKFCDQSSFTEINFESPVNVLGLLWDRTDDSLMISLKVKWNNDSPTKREILSVTQGIFDPIGFLVPVLLPAKLLIQQAWASKSQWDAPLPDDIKIKFKKWYEELDLLSGLKIPRRVGFGDQSGWSLHVCCDASQNAYATVIFLRCKREKRQVSVQLLAARSRLAPLKKMTIPRLELLACVLGARLSKFIVDALTLISVPVYFWSDSTTALAWIKRNDQWGTFVGNRVREICKLTDPKQWLHLPGPSNPADLPSRGCTPQQLLDTKWWEGPAWLHTTKDSWPSSSVTPDEELVTAERRKGTTVNLVVSPEAHQWFERISKFSRIVKVFCWIRRFIAKTQKREIPSTNVISVEERSEGEKALWRLVQKESFLKKNNSIKDLVVVKDEEDIIRVKTKIIERDDEFAFRYPILLPSNHHVVKCLITECHLKNCHAGVQLLASKLREHYWIISARRNIRNIITKCVVCKRFVAKAQTAPPIHLPLDRVRDAAVFEVVGIDLCGPLYLKTKSKVWIVLFTCAVYRAVHLELVTALSTEAFIQALRRFIARRGRPATIYTDNGTNFSGTENALKNLKWDKIESDERLFPVKWKFIPPTAAWWGGWWERLIRSVKALLLRVLGRASLKYEELLTILCDVEASINSRPLTYLSEGSEDLVPLTPSMFLQDIKEVGVPDLDAIDSKKLQLRNRYCQKLREDLRSRFRREYLGQLVQRVGEKRTDLKVGDVVLVGIDNVKRLHWPMAKVVEIFPSRDNSARVARLKTKSGTLVRPVQKLFPLEVTSRSDPIQQSPLRLSRFGRIIKTPNRLNL